MVSASSLTLLGPPLQQGGSLLTTDVFQATRFSDRFQRQSEAYTADGPEVGRDGEQDKRKPRVKSVSGFRSVGFTLG